MNSINREQRYAIILEFATQFELTSNQFGLATGQFDWPEAI